MQKLESVTILSKIAKIKEFAFEGCIMLENFEVPSGVEIIGDAAFAECMSLKWIRLPKSLAEIGDGILAGCDSLTTIYGTGGSLAQDLAINGDYEFEMVEEGEKIDNGLKYDGYDYISSIYYNQTWKYDSDEIGCEVYEWGEEVVLPIPKPDGESALQIIDGSYYLMGIDKNEWDAYVKLLSERYLIESDYYESEEYSSGSVKFTDLENNFTGYMNWGGGSIFDDMRNYCTGYVFVGSPDKNTELSNEEVLDKVLVKLNYDNKEGFSIVNVNSKTNYEDGFDVYLINTSYDYVYANDYANTYICVLKEDEIVLLESVRIYFGVPASVEFIKVGDAWKAYIAQDNGASGNVGIDLIEYEMVEGVFVKVQEHNIDGQAVMRKNVDVIEIYALESNGSIEDTPVYGWYKVGDKVAIIGSEGVKEIE